MNGFAAPRPLPLLTSLLLLMTGCGEPTPPGSPDSGPPTADAGRGVPDAGVDAGTDAGTPVSVAAVPREAVMLGGQAYLAWQRPGDTFRIVCQEPCPIEESYVFARYAGFLAVKDELLALTGIDVHPLMTPVDIHLMGDSLCGPESPSLAGASFMNWTDSGPGPGSHVCLWELEASRKPPPYVARALTVENALARENQVLLVHEYSHILFFLRHEFSYEWLVRALSYRVGGEASSLCDDLNRNLARPGWELCQRHGFDFPLLAPSLTALESLYASDGGTDARYQDLPYQTTGYQYRRIVDGLVGEDTLAACIAGGELRANQCGDSARFLPEGGTVRMYEGAVQWELTAGAVSASVQVEPDTWSFTRAVDPAWQDFAFAHTYAFTPAEVGFLAPVRLTLRYDPARIPDGGSEASLTLYRAGGNFGGPVSGASVDVDANTVSGIVPTLGRYLVAPR